MYRLTREFLEYLADKLQIGDKAPNYDFRIYKKIGDGKYDPSPVRFEKDVNTIEIDRRWDMSTDELQIIINNVNGKYSPDYSTKKQFDGVERLYPSGYHKAISPFNRVEVDMGYGDQLARIFTGQIQEIDIREMFPTISLTAKNEFRKLLKPIDPIWSRELVYENKKAMEIVLDLCKRAGIENVMFEMDEIKGHDYGINKAEFEIGTDYKDAVSKILETMGHRIFADRLGVIRIQKLEEYAQKDMVHWEFNDYVNLSDGGYKIDASIIRNRVIVQSKNSWKVYEDPFLIDICNGERMTMSVEAPWAETDEQKRKVSDYYFIQMRRKLRRLTIATIGNPTMDTGDLAKLKMLTSTANAKYMITGIRSSFSDAGYIDIVDLEFVTDTKGIAVPAKGNYDIKKEEGKGEGKKEKPVKNKSSKVSYSLRDKIVNEAKKWLGTYYQWGGDCAHNSRHYGMDCSHFTYTVYKKFGLMGYYRTAAGQHSWAKKVTKKQLLKGDLVFYTNSRGRVGHVGIYIGNNKVISATGGGSSTNSKARARQRNAKVKIHRLNYRRGPYYYGRAHSM